MTRRRLLVGLGASVCASPRMALAQPAAAQIHRLGFLGSEFAAGYAGNIEALRDGLRRLGYIEGKNLIIEFRWAEGVYDRLPGLAAELVRLKIDVLVTHGTPGALAARRATATIPVVMATVGDPVSTGLVSSLARPGGNITGSATITPDLMVKRLELLKEAFPRITRVAVLANPDNPARQVDLGPMPGSARALKVELQTFEVRGPQDFDGAFAAMARARAEALIIHQDGKLNASGKAIADLAFQHRLPSVGIKEFAEAGGLLGYGASFLELFRRAAAFVDKILKGAKPADLPIERATTFELVINRRTANALGLTIIPAVLLCADTVVE
jgi:putative ABC transport system substrate-binding protein